MGRRKSGRNVNGVILLNKPRDISSNAALQQVRRFLNANKAGHTGALDPAATGLLPLCFGESTKVSHYSLEADKAYQVVAKLGVRTTTSDADGEVVETAPQEKVDAVTQEDISAAIAKFTGEQEQSPSMYSALKYEGRPLYYYAREGIEVPRKTRTITIHKITQLDWQQDLLTLEVTCSKGTYIRTLVDDMGQLLGCGAHVAELHRTWIEGVEGPIYTAAELAEIAAQTNPEQGDYAAMDALLLPNDCVVQHIPELLVADEDALRFVSGNPVPVTATPTEELDHYRVKRASDRVFLGMGTLLEAASGADDLPLITPKRVINNALNK